jgi:branched-chain amino acid transport system substrate-binding protein
MRSRPVACVVAAGILILTACGDDEDTDATTPAVAQTTGEADTTPGAADTTSGSPGATTETSEAMAGTTAAGGTATTGEPKAADESLEPVTVGFHNLEGGGVSLPEIRHGFEAGIKYVNEELGGINGHPIEIESCNVDFTPESSVNCANQFVEAGVEVAVQGVDYAADAALPVLRQAGIAEIALAAFTPGVNSSEGDAFVTLASTQEFLGADMKAMNELGTTNVAVVLLDTPAGRAYESDVIRPILEQLEMDSSFHYFQPQTDWTSFSAVIAGSGADGISFPAPEEGNILAAVPALRAAGFEGPIHAGSTVEYLEQLDEDLLENIYNHKEFYYTTFTEIPERAQQDIDIWQRYMESEGYEEESPLYTQLGFHVAVTAMDMVSKTEGELTAENIKASLPKAKGHTFFRTTDYDCSKPVWPGTTACGAGVIFVKATPDRKVEETDFSPLDISELVPE